ncbi:MAG: BatD family protein [Catalinimonas sp.]
MRRLHYVILLILSALVRVGFAQDAEIKLGKREIALNEAFTITVTIRDDDLRGYGRFPTIEGFSKAGTSSSTSTNMAGGKISSTQSITQNYVPEREGTFRLPPFEMAVNGNTYGSPGATIKVGPPAQAQRRQSPFGFDPFEDLFGRDKPRDYVEVEEEAFLALSVPDDTVYVGEGFTVTLAFYVAETNQADMRFHELGQQLGGILKKLRPANCWEENFNIEAIQPRPITLNGRSYRQFKIYQATFYPLNAEPIQFPSIGLKMIKYEVARNPSFFGRNRREDFKMFYTSPKIVGVRELPPHPRRDRVAVGSFSLKEQIADTALTTGESFDYTFKITGEGNISAITPPTPPASEAFDIYPPSADQNIRRANARVEGSKAFNFFAVPNEAGRYDLGELFEWIYFDPKRVRYDTLRSEVRVAVTGDSQRNAIIQANRRDDFYDQIATSGNALVRRDWRNWVRLVANGSILLMIALSAFVLIKK